MKKHYITPAIKDINIIVTQSPLAGSIQGGIDENSTDTQLTGGHRDSHSSWGNLWGVGEEE